MSARFRRGFDHLRFLDLLGEPVPQYDRQLVWDLVPESDMDDVHHPWNPRALAPHTEGYELAGRPPRYLALWCVRPAKGPGGETTLADGYAFLRRFSPGDRQRLREVRYEWHASEGLARHGIALRAVHPPLADHDGRLILRYSHNNVVPVDDGLLPRFLAERQSFFESVSCW